jgi:hypothetical protein
MIKGKGGNKYADGSIKTLKLILNTHNKISSIPISKMTDLQEKRRDRKLNVAVDLFDTEGLRTILTGAGRDAFNGYSFNKKTREFEFIWYFTNSAQGDRQLVKAVKKILSLDLELMKVDMTPTLHISTTPM